MSRRTAYWLFRGAYPLAVQKNSGLWEVPCGESICRKWRGNRNGYSAAARSGIRKSTNTENAGAACSPYILRCAHRAGGNRYIKYLNYKLTNSMLKKSSYYATILINRIGASLFERSDNYKRKKER